MLKNLQKCLKTCKNYQKHATKTWKYIKKHVQNQKKCTIINIITDGISIVSNFFHICWGMNNLGRQTTIPPGQCPVGMQRKILHLLQPLTSVFELSHQFTVCDRIWICHLLLSLFRPRYPMFEVVLSDALSTSANTDAPNFVIDSDSLNVFLWFFVMLFLFK